MKADLDVRVEAFVAAAPAVDAAARAGVLPHAARVGALPGRVVLATCHRVEVLALGQGSVRSVDRRALLGAGMERIDGELAARHVIGLAVGLESAVVGEDQVLHQLRTAVADARTRGPLDPDLGSLLDAALRAGRLGRSWRPVEADRPDRSLADRAVRRVATALDGLTDRQVLVVGTGAMGRAAAAGLLAGGARVHVASRHTARASEVAADVGASVAPFDPGRSFVDGMDAIVVALGAAWAVSAATGDALTDRRIVVDLSMPPALSADQRLRLGERLTDIDDLAEPGPHDRRHERYRARLDALVDGTLASWLDAVAARRTSAADRLAERIERQRTAGLEAYLRQRPELDPEVRRELDDVTRDLSERLFREPLARLSRDPDGRRRRALDELFGG